MVVLPEVESGLPFYGTRAPQARVSSHFHHRTVGSLAWTRTTIEPSRGVRTAIIRQGNVLTEMGRLGGIKPQSLQGPQPCVLSLHYNRHKTLAINMDNGKMKDRGVCSVKSDTMLQHTLEDYIGRGFSSYQIAVAEGLHPNTIRYWILKYGLKTNHPYRRGGGRFVNSVIHQMPLEELRSLINQSESTKQVIEKLGMNVCAYQYKALRARVGKEGIDTSHFKHTSTNGGRYPVEALAAITKPLEQVLKEETVVSNSGLKKRLLKAGLIKDECQRCGNIGIWNGEPLTLQLDHINGLRVDNRIENLRLLCPNCHSQTPTWGAKRRGEKPTKIKVDKPARVRVYKIEWPADDALKAMVWKDNLSDVARLLGVSSTSIRRRCENNDIPLPPPQYLTRRRHGMNHEDALNPPVVPRKIHHKNRFTDEQALDIIARIAKGETLRSIGRVYGVDHCAISNIKRGRFYQHLPRPWNTDSGRT